MLDFDEHERLSALIFDPVRGTHRDVNRLSRAEPAHIIAERQRARAMHDEPVLAALVVKLQTQALPRGNHDALHFECRFVGQHEIFAPRTNIVFSRFVHVVPIGHVDRFLLVLAWLSSA